MPSNRRQRLSKNISNYKYRKSQLRAKASRNRDNSLTTKVRNKETNE